jgi:hypothetical protein
MRLNQEVLKSTNITWRRIEALSDELDMPEKVVYKYTYDCRMFLEHLDRIYKCIIRRNNGKIFNITRVKPG